jgi:hypothetical protein
MSSTLQRALAAAALVLAAGAAQAGRSCEAKPPEAANVQRAMTLAARTAQALDASGAQVVVLARVGQDLGRYGLTWSHLGFAYKDGGRWRVVHKLNQCGSAQAAVYRQGLGEFFLDDLHDYRAGFVVLTPALQQALRPTLLDNDRLAQVHTPAYNMVAYPWSQRYQQSNQWALETLASTQSAAAATRAGAQAWLQAQGYTPTTLHLNAFTRLGARATASNIAFDDHPNEKRFTDRIETVTVDSVFAWLNRGGLGAPVQVIR